VKHFFGLWNTFLNTTTEQAHTCRERESESERDKKKKKKKRRRRRRRGGGRRSTG
jgi:hypothetical protein